MMKKYWLGLVGCCALLSPISAAAATKNPTPINNYRYATKRASYYTKSTSKYYRSVWKSAQQAWNKTKAFKWSTTKNKRSRSYVTTVSKKTGIWTNATGMAYSGKSFDQNGHQTGAGMYLNRYVLKQYHYTKKQRSNVAIHELGHGLGLAHNSAGAVSVMGPTNRKYTIRNCDVKGVQKAYSTPVKTRATLTAAAKPELEVDHVKDYDGLNGLQHLKKAASVIVEGEITKSVSHHKAPKNYYTTQTLHIDQRFKGTTGRTITFTQGGTKTMAVADSEILPQHENLLVMLAKNANGQYYVINDGQGMFLDTHNNNGHELFEHVSDHTIYTEDMLH